MIAIGSVFFDPEKRAVLTPDANRVRLRPKSLEVLSVLAARPGETIGKDDLIAAVWRDVNVTDDSLTQCVADIRRAIGDMDRNILQTVPKEGYRLVAAQRVDGTAPRAPDMRQSPAKDGSKPNPNTMTDRRLSIVMLPFFDHGLRQEQSYLADGLTEDLTTDLSRISGCFVISRRTAATYAGQDRDLREIARELGVKYVLAGTIRTDGRLIRVDVELIDGASSQNVWSDRFEKIAQDIHAFQTEITGRIARALNLELKEAESRQARRHGGADDLALRAWVEVWAKPQARVSNETALRYVAQALDLDPENAEAHGVAAYAYARMALYDWGMSREDAIAAGIASAERSLAQDPKNTDATYALGFLNYLSGKTAVSLELMRHVIALNRNHAPSHFFVGVNLIRMGLAHEAITSIEQAFALSPRDPLRSVWYGMLGRAQVLLGRDVEAIETAAKGIAANIAHPHNYSVKASAHAHLGQDALAQRALEEFLSRQPGVRLEAYSREIASDDPVSLHAYQRFIAGLRKAGLRE